MDIKLQEYNNEYNYNKVINRNTIGKSENDIWNIQMTVHFSHGIGINEYQGEWKSMSLSNWLPSAQCNWIDHDYHDWWSADFPGEGRHWPPDTNRLTVSLITIFNNSGVIFNDHCRQTGITLVYNYLHLILVFIHWCAGKSENTRLDIEITRSSWECASYRREKLFNVVTLHLFNIIGVTLVITVLQWEALHLISEDEVHI